MHRDLDGVFGTLRPGDFDASATDVSMETTPVKANRAARKVCTAGKTSHEMAAAKVAPVKMRSKVQSRKKPKTKSFVKKVSPTRARILNTYFTVYLSG